MTMILVLTGAAFWIVVSAVVIAPLVVGFAVSASIHRWHLARMRAGKRRLKIKDWPAFARSFLRDILEYAEFPPFSRSVTISAPDGVWSGVGKWSVFSGCESAAHES